MHSFHPWAARRLLFGLVVAVPAVVSAAEAARPPLTAEEQRLVAAVDTTPDNFAADLGQAVAIDSATENLAGVRQMGELFAAQLAAIGFDSHFVPLPASTGRAGHLVAEHRGSKGQRVLLIGHLDTVFPGGNFRREGDHVTGSGVSDMKGGDLMLIHALRALHRAGLLADTQIIVVMSGDEESPGSPIDVARRDMREAAKRSDVALAFEAAIGNTGTVARRGAAFWQLEVQGATGHSSGMFSAAMGSGSAFETARILQGFYEQLHVMDGLTINPALLVGGTTAEVTPLEVSAMNGTATAKYNIVPQRTVVRGDLRFLSNAQLEEAQAKMEEVLRHPLPRTSAELKFRDNGYPAMAPTPGNYGLLAKLDQASRDLGYGEITAFDPRGRGAGDVAFVSPPLPGLDGLGMAGGKGEHTTHESAELARVNELVKRAALLIYRLTR